MKSQVLSPESDMDAHVATLTNLSKHKWEVLCDCSKRTRIFTLNSPDLLHLNSDYDLKVCVLQLLVDETIPNWIQRSK